MVPTTQQAATKGPDDWVPVIEKITVADIVDSPDQPKERTSDVRGLAESMRVIGQNDHQTRLEGGRDYSE